MFHRPIHMKIASILLMIQIILENASSNKSLKLKNYLITLF